MFFLATSHTKNTISEKTNKHTIQLIYPKKRYEHTLFWKVIIKACWFGEQYSNLPTEFARNAKRGAPKKQTGRLKNSEKALSEY